MDNLNLVKSKYKFNYEFKEEQKIIFNSVALENMHTFGVLPTGFGKSDCFVVPQLLVDEDNSSLLNLLDVPRKKSTHRFGDFPIEESNAQSDDNMERAGSEGYIIEGQYSVVFCSPESIVRDPWRTMLGNAHYKERLCLLACDEAHCIVEWGDDFRPSYKQVTVLRSLTTCPILVLTATATESMRQNILSTLLLDEEEVKTVAIVPDRTMTQVADIYEFVMTELGDKAWSGDSHIIDNRLVDMFHSSIDADTEKKNSQCFSTNR
uniref:ATP-dependent DNA helicase Q-like SIM-like n=1 Tax=Saccoglossus kowalevskii TaxID=10224 RepID=A0ABM0LYL2_SACKO|nr:PREDICTED: ATP-dependent DNA helicase Q-like SIM-like [Saccoglossus kowalevskii]